MVRGASARFSRIQAVDPMLSTGQTRTLLDAVRAKFGRASNFIRVLANNQAVLDGHLAQSSALSAGELDLETRHSIRLAVSGAIGEPYFAAEHAELLRGLNLPNAEIDARLAGKASTSDLSEILSFARKLTIHQGELENSDFERLRKNGASDAAIIEIISNAAFALASAIIGIATQVEIDRTFNDTAPSEA